MHIYCMTTTEPLMNAVKFQLIFLRVKLFIYLIIYRPKVKQDSTQLKCCATSIYVDQYCNTYLYG